LPNLIVCNGYMAAWSERRFPAEDCVIGHGLGS
jgi:hypothetical protein